jgi:hypothetical protein
MTELQLNSSKKKKKKEEKWLIWGRPYFGIYERF